MLKIKLVLWQIAMFVMSFWHVYIKPRLQLLGVHIATTNITPETFIHIDFKFTTISHMVMEQEKISPFCHVNQIRNPEKHFFKRDVLYARRDGCGLGDGLGWQMGMMFDLRNILDDHDQRVSMPFQKLASAARWVILNGHLAPL